MPEGLLARIDEFFRQGGFVMPPLVAGAMLLWYALGYRMLALRRGSRLPVRVLLAERKKSAADREPRGVIETAVARGLEEARDQPDNLRRRLDVAFHDHEKEIGKYAVLVAAIVIVAPLTGLLGTVSGMIETFDSLGEMALFSQSGGVAGGISEALFSTQMGLAVAIPGLLIGRILERRQTRLEMELSQLKNLLCARAAA